MEDSQKQNLVMAFTNVLRTSSLAGVVDIQRASMAFSAFLDEIPAGQPVPLEPLYTFLRDQGAPEAGVREVVVFLKSRESRFGVPLELPASLAALSADEQQKIVSSFAQRGTTSGTYAGRPVNAPAAPAAPGAQPKVEEFGKKKAGARNRTPLLAGIAGVLVVLFVVDQAVKHATREAPPVPVTLDAAGLPCQNPTMAQGIVRCPVTPAFLKQPREVIRAKAELTRTSAQALGATRLVLLNSETGAAEMAF